MESVIAWSGFLGAWLLVAGPIYQAALELQEEAIESGTYARLSASVGEPRRVSSWWWLLPPVAYLKQRRRARRYREAVMAQMTPDQIEQLVRFTTKATGWLLVASGAGFIAVKETWELGEHYEWPVAVFWPLVAVMLLVCTLYTVVRTRRSHELYGS